MVAERVQAGSNLSLKPIHIKRPGNSTPLAFAHERETRGSIRKIFSDKGITSKNISSSIPLVIIYSHSHLLHRDLTFLENSRQSVARCPPNHSLLLFGNKKGRPQFHMNEASHEEDAKIAIQEILQQTDLVFKKFHAGLDQQIKRLETCKMQTQKLQLTRLRVKRYFQELNDFLKNKQYSSCAWEIVQIQLRECFLLIHQLIQRIPTQGIKYL
uniref:Uncharacterized protein n=1 Tax=Laticauda laticaudata TaxID=8630 RepID=A0A8C5WWI7_LATLA